jgi:hypothetical protein
LSNPPRTDSGSSARKGARSNPAFGTTLSQAFIKNYLH